MKTNRNSNNNMNIFSKQKMLKSFPRLQSTLKAHMGQLGIDLNLFVLEYCESQRCFHIETIEEMLLRNAEIYADSSNVGYYPLAFFKTRKEANTVADTLDKDKPEQINETN